MIRYLLRHFFAPFSERMHITDLPNKGKIFEFKNYEWEEVAEKLDKIYKEYELSLNEEYKRLSEEGKIRETTEEEKRFRKSKDMFNKGLLSEEAYTREERAHDVFVKENKNKLKNETFSISQKLKMNLRRNIETLRLIKLANEVVTLVEEGKSVVVFTQFVESVNVLLRQLEDFKDIIRVCSVHGKMPQRERNDAIMGFQKNIKNVMICTIASMSEGVSLHDLNGDYPRVSLVCPTYNATHFKQAMGRIYRANSKSVAHVIGVYCNHKIEVEQAKNYTSKINNIDTVNASKYNSFSNIEETKNKEVIND